jgi:hypothetical protein
MQRPTRRLNQILLEFVEVNVLPAEKLLLMCVGKKREEATIYVQCWHYDSHAYQQSIHS